MTSSIRIHLRLRSLIYTARIGSNVGSAGLAPLPDITTTAFSTRDSTQLVASS